jgi:hypothetical protein
MARKPAPKPKLTDAERHKRFVEMAREVGASDDPKDFESAFKKVTSKVDLDMPCVGRMARSETAAEENGFLRFFVIGF